MSMSMRMFSLSMRSLYVEKAVGSKAEAAVKFRELRDDTRNDAMVYLKGILPLSTKFVSSISEYFEYFDALEFEEWCNMLSDILEETIGYRQLCETLLQMHEDILVPLKKRQDEAKLKGEIQKSSTMDAVVTLRKDLKDMSKNLRLFSLSMRSLYTENFVRMKAETGQKFKKLRDDTRNDAMVYLKGILPLSRTFAKSMSDYFKYYETLDFQKWCELLSSIREKTVGNKKLCEMILKLHEDILVPLKKRQDQAELVVTECEGLQEKFEEKKKEYEDKAQTKTNWAFIEGITRTAGFFSIVEQEISKFEGKAGKAIDTRKRLHYKVMKREAQDMNSVCQAFSAALLDVNADFDVISSEGTDQNYVDRCLEKHSRTIKATC
ncbi:unnamed protein product, partial [Porites lobata]